MTPRSAAHRVPAAGLQPRRARTFELRVLPRGDLGYGLALYDHTLGAADPDQDPVTRVWGDPLLEVMDHVLRAIRRAGYRTTDLKATRRAPFLIAEEDAVRLGLLFTVLKPLRKHRRMEEAARAIASMAPEEVYYWYSKTTTGPERRRVQRAFRIMVSDE